MLYDVEDFVVEQVVEDAVSCADDHVAEVNLAGVLIGLVRGVLADVVLALLKHLTQLNAFLDLALLLEQLDVLFSGQDGELEGRVERVDLFLRPRVEVGLADELRFLPFAAVLLAVVHEPAVAQVGEVHLLLVQHPDQRRRAAHRGHPLVRLLQHVERVQVLSLLFNWLGLNRKLVVSFFDVKVKEAAPFAYPLQFLFLLVILTRFTVELLGLLPAEGHQLGGELLA